MTEHQIKRAFQQLREAASKRTYASEEDAVVNQTLLDLAEEALLSLRRVADYLESMSVD